MTDVVGIHGIGQQQQGRNQLLGAWSPALADGIERFAGRHGGTAVLDIAYYADLFLAAHGTKGVPTADMRDVDWDDDTLAFLGDIEREVVDESAPEVADKGFGALPRPAARLAAWLDDRFGLAGRVLFFGDLVQVRRYQRDDELGRAVRGRVQEAVDARPHVVVGHSLGSVVAYEYLCLTPDHGVETLVTLGSPLALRSIQADLRTHGPDDQPRFPSGVKRWVNIYDVNDPVACGGGLHATWPAVTDVLVDNERDAHAAVRYLGKRETGQAVVEGLRG